MHTKGRDWRVGGGTVREKCTIWNVSKFGRVLHVLTSSSIVERMISAISGVILVSVPVVSCGCG